MAFPNRTRAENLFELVGLGRRPTNDPCARDLRWRKRREAQGHAIIARQTIEAGGDIDRAIELAKALGFWSVWITVFGEHPQVCDRLRRCFPGTK